MKTYCLLNHTLTENQITELREKFGSTEIIYPTKELAGIWSQIAPAETLDISCINSVTEWLDGAEAGDTFIIQGEFGHTFALVDYAISHGLVPLHAVARRMTEEVMEGETVRKNLVFRHVCFRKYFLYSKLYNHDKIEIKETSIK